MPIIIRKHEMRCFIWQELEDIKGKMVIVSSISKIQVF
ncbi:hypothetical protein CLK_1453 [Clostridium botulinum A3 str. Loch Maree]|nr:hypothetical protein CLK_1453 [Clostridium botulinum A3 str. Loch Maree]